MAPVTEMMATIPALRAAASFGLIGLPPGPKGSAWRFDCNVPRFYCEMIAPTEDDCFVLNHS
jgi:hypothetical protein